MFDDKQAYSRDCAEEIVVTARSHEISNAFFHLPLDKVPKVSELSKLQHLDSNQHDEES
jgi:hypothetical protein